MRGVALCFVLVVALATAQISRCSWCDKNVDVNKLRRQAKVIAQVKIARSGHLEQPMDLTWKLSVNQARTRSYKFGNHFK
jgi:hypothetical protein